jgi:lipoate-protein ligase A
LTNNYFCITQSRPGDVFSNLALEESISLWLNSSDFSGGLRFWQNKSSVILGISDNYELNKPMDKNIPVARRASGGGTVYHEEYLNQNYSIFISLKTFPSYYPVEYSYRKLSEIIITSLKSQGIHSEMAGKSDISIMSQNDLKKISGNSQFRKKDSLVHHGTLILSRRLIQKVGSILPHPPNEPEYRKKRNHEDFLTHLPEDFSLSKFREDMKNYFSLVFRLEEKKITLGTLKFLMKESEKLKTEKYSKEEFIKRT